LDFAVQRRVVDFMDQRVVKLDEPWQIAKPLHGGLRGYWRYRIGDYRVICEIKRDVMTVLVLEIGHRREVYRR
jgi:mRNA interferase RelE/StbE